MFQKIYITFKIQINTTPIRLKAFKKSRENLSTENIKW